MSLLYPIIHYILSNYKIMDSLNTKIEIESAIPAEGISHDKLPSLPALCLIATAAIAHTILGELRCFPVKLIESNSEIPGLIKYDDENPKHIEARKLLEDRAHRIHNMKGRVPSWLKVLVNGDFRTLLADTLESTDRGTRIYELEEDGLMPYATFERRTSASPQSHVFRFLTRRAND